MDSEIFMDNLFDENGVVIATIVKSINLDNLLGKGNSYLTVTSGAS